MPMNRGLIRVKKKPPLRVNASQLSQSEADVV